MHQLEALVFPPSWARPRRREGRLYAPQESHRWRCRRTHARWPLPAPARTSRVERAILCQVAHRHAACWPAQSRGEAACIAGSFERRDAEILSADAQAQPLSHLQKGAKWGNSNHSVSSWHRTASRAIPTRHHLPEDIPRISRRAPLSPSAPELRHGERNLERGRHGS